MTLICGVLCLLGALVFGTFAQGEVQPWAKAPDDPIATGDVGLYENVIEKQDEETSVSPAERNSPL